MNNSMVVRYLAQNSKGLKKPKFKMICLIISNTREKSMIPFLVRLRHQSYSTMAIRHRYLIKWMISKFWIEVALRQCMKNRWVVHTSSNLTRRVKSRFKAVLCNHLLKHVQTLIKEASLWNSSSKIRPFTWESLMVPMNYWRIKVCFQDWIYDKHSMPSWLKLVRSKIQQLWYSKYQSRKTYSKKPSL